MALDTKAKRAAALGFGLASLLVLPPAQGGLTIEDAGHALSAYRWDLGTITYAYPVLELIAYAALDTALDVRGARVTELVIVTLPTEET